MKLLLCMMIQVCSCGFYTLHCWNTERIRPWRFNLVNSVNQVLLLDHLACPPFSLNLGQHLYSLDSQSASSIWNLLLMQKGYICWYLTLFFLQAFFFYWRKEADCWNIHALVRSLSQRKVKIMMKSVNVWFKNKKTGGCVHVFVSAVSGRFSG